MDRKSIAKTAFYGGKETLFDAVCLKNGYEWEGKTIPANGISLADCIKTVEHMTEQEIARYV